MIDPPEVKSGQSQHPRLRELYYNRGFLKPDQAYSFVFQTDPPPQDIKSFAAQAVSDFLASGLMGRISNLTFTLGQLNKTEISSKNVYPLAFRKNTEPWWLVEDIFKENYPQAVKLTNKEQITLLENQLKEEKVLTKGIFVGTVLLSTQLKLLGNEKFKGSIAIGVIDEETNNPLGIVFCPEGMLDYEFIDYKQGKIRKRAKQALTSRQPIPVGVEI